MEQRFMDTADQHQQMLTDQYGQLRLDLTHLQSEPFKDLVAIDATMKKIDAVQAQLKALHSRASDPQRY